jgi:copper resistance protein C
VTVVPQGRGGPRPRSVRATTTPHARVLAVAVILVGCVLAQLVGSAPASAHNSLVSSSPADGADLARAPGAVTLTFDQPVGRKFGVVAVTGPDGDEVQRDTLHVSGATATQPLHPLRQPGAYKVAWRVVSADGHPITGTFSFRLDKGAADPPAGSPTTESPSSTPEASAARRGPGAASSAAERDASGTGRWPIVVGGIALIPLVAVGVVLALRRRPEPDSGDEG